MIGRSIKILTIYRISGIDCPHKLRAVFFRERLLVRPQEVFPYPVRLCWVELNNFLNSFTNERTDLLQDHVELAWKTPPGYSH